MNGKLISASCESGMARAWAIDVSYFPIDEIPQEDTSAIHRAQARAMPDSQEAALLASITPKNRSVSGHNKPNWFGRH
jgi:hypothetical protein